MECAWALGLTNDKQCLSDGSWEKPGRYGQAWWHEKVALAEMRVAANAQNALPVLLPPSNINIWGTKRQKAIHSRLDSLKPHQKGITLSLGYSAAKQMALRENVEYKKNQGTKEQIRSGKIEILR